MSKSVSPMRRPTPAKTAIVDTEAAERFINQGEVAPSSKAPETPVSTKEPTTRTTLDLPKSVHKAMKRHCVDNDMSIAEYLRGLIERDLS